MRRLMLLRHAKSDWSASGQRDIDRILAVRGREVTPIIGRYTAPTSPMPLTPPPSKTRSRLR